MDSKHLVITAQDGQFIVVNAAGSKLGGRRSRAGAIEAAILYLSSHGGGRSRFENLAVLSLRALKSPGGEV